MNKEKQSPPNLSNEQIEAAKVAANRHPLTSPRNGIKSLIMKILYAVRTVEKILGALVEEKERPKGYKATPQALKEASKEARRICENNLPALLWQEAALELTVGEARVVAFLRERVRAIVSKLQQEPFREQEHWQETLRDVVAIENKILEIEEFFPVERKDASLVLCRILEKDKREQEKQSHEKWWLVSYAVTPPFLIECIRLWMDYMPFK